MRDAVEAFLLTKQIASCTSATITTYRWWLQHFITVEGWPPAESEAAPATR